MTIEAPSQVGEAVLHPVEVNVAVYHVSNESAGLKSWERVSEERSGIADGIVSVRDMPDRVCTGSTTTSVGRVNAGAVHTTAGVASTCAGDTHTMDSASSVDRSISLQSVGI